MVKRLDNFQIYSDVPFSMKLDNKGDVPQTSEQVAIKQSIFNILNTTRGQRPLLPTFGSKIAGYLFEIFDPRTGAKIGESVKRELTNREPRINVSKINVIMDTDAQVYTIEIIYFVVSVKIIDSVTIDLQKL